MMPTLFSKTESKFYHFNILRGYTHGTALDSVHRKTDGDLYLHLHWAGSSACWSWGLILNPGVFDRGRVKRCPGALTVRSPWERLGSLARSLKIQQESRFCVKAAHLLQCPGIILGSILLSWGRVESVDRWEAAAKTSPNAEMNASWYPSGGVGTRAAMQGAASGTARCTWTMVSSQRWHLLPKGSLKASNSPRISHKN